jgi:glycosyltransferase involved in cell wall biosynthesis
LSLFHIDAGREWSGTERQALILAREARARGFVSRLVVQPKSPLHEKAAAEGLPVLAVRMPGGRSLGAILRMAGAMKRGRCVLVHFHDAPALAVGSPAASLAKVPIRVLTRQTDPGGRRGRAPAKHIDMVIAGSEGVKNVLVRGGLPERSVEVVPAGIDFSPYQDIGPRDFLRKEFSFAQDDFLVGVVAGLEDPRSYREVIEAAAVIREHAPKAKIIVLGEGSLRLEPDKKGHDFPANDAVYYLGFRSDMARVLASLDVFVTTSPLIGFGGSLLDAMACRVPVVAEETGGAPDVIVHRETGLLSPSRNPRSLAEAVLKLYMDRNLAARLAQRGAEAVREKYSAEAMARRVIAVYERLASQKGIKLG